MSVQYDILYSVISHTAAKNKALFPIKVGKRG